MKYIQIAMIVVLVLLIIRLLFDKKDEETEGKRDRLFHLQNLAPISFVVSIYCYVGFASLVLTVSSLMGLMMYFLKELRFPTKVHKLIVIVFVGFIILFCTKYYYTCR